MVTMLLMISIKLCSHAPGAECPTPGEQRHEAISLLEPVECLVNEELEQNQFADPAIC